MKFFRQKSSHQKRHSIFNYSSKSNRGSIDEIVKKLRIAFDESENNENAETNDNIVRQSLENLRYNIFEKIEANRHRNDNNDLSDIISYTDELFSSDVLLQIVEKLPRVGFESKKIISAIVCNALLLQIDDRLVTVEYIAKEANILYALIESYKYGRSDITLNCGRILRDCIQHECLARIALHSELFEEFFTYMNQNTFDVAMDAFLTFRLLLTTHKSLTEHYLMKNHNNFFNNFHQLIKSDNYVTKRQSLEILGIILSEKQNIKVRQLFIMDSKNLRIIMNLFWHKYKHIRFRALNIFNVIVNSQEKPISVMNFLMPNRDKLVEVLIEFQNECNGSKIFADQKPFVSQMILYFKTSKQ